MPEQVDQPIECCNSVESPCGSRVLSGSVVPWGTTLKQFAPEALHPPERIQAGAVCEEEVQPVRRIHVGEVHGGLSLVGGTTHWSRRLQEFILLRSREQQRHVIN